VVGVVEGTEAAVGVVIGGEVWKIRWKRSEYRER